jgi:hypothetical protein
LALILGDGSGLGQGPQVEIRKKLTEIPEVEQRADERQKEPKDRAAIGETFTELAISGIVRISYPYPRISDGEIERCSIDLDSNDIGQIRIK